MQNTSRAVMAQRVEDNDGPDDFPTPPWATRGLIEYVLNDKAALAKMTCLEPACGGRAHGEGAKGVFQRGLLFRCL
jgi:hypothetical protein